MIDVILVDGTSYIFRAFHALPLLTTSTYIGQSTSFTADFVQNNKRIAL